MARVGSPALCQGGACGHGELPPQPPLPGHPQVEEPNPALLAAPRPWAAPTRGDQRRAPRAPLSAPSRRSCSPAGPRGAPRAQHTSSPTCCLILARAADGSGKMTARSRSRGEGFCSELPALLQAFGAFSWHLLGGALRRLRARVGTPGKESKDVGEACPGFQIPLRRNSCRWLSTASQQGTNRRTEITRAKWRQSPCKGPAGAALAPPPPAREAGGSFLEPGAPLEAEMFLWCGYGSARCHLCPLQFLPATHEAGRFKKKVCISCPLRRFPWKFLEHGRCWHPSPCSGSTEQPCQLPSAPGAPTPR